MEDNNYRPCVGIMLFNKEGHVFVGKRFDSWQMPQGGIETGEKLEQAALRELLEETGISRVEILAKSKKWLYYNIPRELALTYHYSGQKQIWFLMKFLGNDKNININYTQNPEFTEWRWESSDNLVDCTVPFKKEVYKLIVNEFKHIIKDNI